MIAISKFGSRHVQTRRRGALLCCHSKDGFPCPTRLHLCCGGRLRRRKKRHEIDETREGRDFAIAGEGEGGGGGGGAEGGGRDAQRRRGRNEIDGAKGGGGASIEEARVCRGKVEEGIEVRDYPPARTLLEGFWSSRQVRHSCAAIYLLSTRMVGADQKRKETGLAGTDPKRKKTRIIEQLFEVGQEAEMRTFAPGFRGAWFRCKIKRITNRQGNLRVALEYIDFPDEKISWTKVFQRPPYFPADAKLNQKKELMVRPRFPSVYHRSEMPDVGSISEVAVIVDDDWKVGDLVDWWFDDCYWSGRVTEVLADKKFQIELHPPPAGEGQSYEASSKDLRPSLDWSIENGWMVCSPHCAQLTKPLHEGRSLPSADMSRLQKVPLNINAPEKSPPETHTNSEKSPPETHTNSEKSPPEIYENSAVASSGLGKANSCDGVSSSNIRVASAEMEVSVSKENHDCDLHCSEKLKSDDHTLLNSMFSDTLEDAIIDLEELANRVIWLKDILQFGGHPSKNSKPSWKFLELRASANSK